MELSAAEREFGVYGDERMFGSDTLYKVPPKDMQKPLHKFTGALTFRSRNSTALGKGTATLISPDLVLTCAHNIYNK
jgi:V8-like Glu-specific endopeptidase